MIRGRTSQQIEMDGIHLSTSFAPVMTKNRSADDLYFSAVLKFRNFDDPIYQYQQEILNQCSRLLNDYPPDYWDNQILRKDDDSP